MAHWSYNTDEERLVARRAARRKWEENNPEQSEAQKKTQRLRRRYGITFPEYKEMASKQNNRCAICGKPPSGVHGSGNPNKLHVDHNHTTKKIRALLCTKCNRGIGYFDENPELLEQAMRYLNAHSG